ncbi:prephenate dehydrogenase/arogenate dehydrogenase family protein [Saccharothrix sp. NRRL B-16314]|uniref:prephenate dehydrogenase/arogenate dehydrogenase family protein n=1 Tax=Saccharothrix sp. NRRL B-16314 TaxID=1463825 RepID=UPI00068E4B01|nr:prephenate dehydrogenase/arogenate dehydrogenase family protein [Saccharothrix sp. NRRL B-16314]
MTLLRRCVLVGGAGAVGGMFARSLAESGAVVEVVDPVRGGDITDIDDALADRLRAADLVLLAVPEPVALAAIGPVAELIRPGALLVDTLSVKSRVVAAAPDDVQMVSLNPMFAPALGMAGRPVAAVVVHDGPLVRELLRLIEQWGGRVVLTGADEHDRLTAAAQALTHASVLGFGVALRAMDVDVERLGAIAPPPHTTMLALLARIASGTPEVYWDVQSANPHAATARKALAEGIRAVADVVERGGEAAFAELLTSLGGALGPQLDRHRELCAGLFAGLASGTASYSDRMPQPTVVQ